MLQNLLRKLLLFLLFAMFLAVYPPLMDYAELPKVALLIAIVPIMSILYVASIPSKNKSAIGISQLFTRVSGTYSLLGLFLFAALFSSVLAGTPESFWGQPYRYQGIIFFVTLTIFSFLVSKYATYDLSLSSIRKAIVIGAGVHVGLIMLQGLAYLFGMSVYTFDGRMTGLLGNPNFAGGVIALSYPYLFYHWQSQKMALALATVAGIIAVLLTDSRAALVGLVLALVLLFVKKMSKKQFLVCLVPVIILLLYFFPVRAISHFDSRTTIWQKGWQAALQKPIFGWGLENFSQTFQAQLRPEGDADLKAIRVDKAHNEFLEIFLGTGLVGLLLYTATVGYTIWVLWKNRAEEFAHLQLVALLVFLLLAQVNVLNSTEYVFFCIAVGVAASLDTVRYT